MAQKKKAHKWPSKREETPDVETQAGMPTEQASAGSAAAVPPLDAYAGVAYEIGAWKGFPNYECRFCAMALLDRDDAIKHFQNEHCTATPEERIVDTGLVDEDGSKIVRVVPAEEV